MKNSIILFMVIIISFLIENEYLRHWHEPTMEQLNYYNGYFKGYLAGVRGDTLEVKRKINYYNEITQ